MIAPNHAKTAIRKIGKKRHASAAQVPATRDDAVEAAMPGPVDDPHCAATDLDQQLVVAEHADPLLAGRLVRLRPVRGRRRCGRHGAQTHRAHVVEWIDRRN
jgi:hypothetical protein